MKYSFSSLVVAACAVAGAVASPAANVTGLQARAGTPSAEGTHDNFFYSWWTDNQGTAYYTNQAGGTYNLEWSGNNGNLVGGKGWNPGTENRVISYNGTYTPNGNSYLAVYGWTRNKLIEYYVVESYGTYNPASAASRKGTVTCNGASYDILSTWRNNQPSIDGTATFEQFWSVRNPKKNPGGAISGTVDFGCHVQAWRGVGMNLGTSHYYQIVATEGYFSSGRATITVSQGSGGQPSTPVTVPSTPVTVPPSTSAPVSTPTQPPSSCSVSKYGQCGGQGFSGCTFCASGSTCQAQNTWYSQCL